MGVIEMTIDGFHNNNLPATKYNIDQHIEYVIGVLSHIDHQTFTLQAALELISYNLSEYENLFSATYFVRQFADFLFKIDIIRTPVAIEVYQLSDRILATTGRNFRFVELIKAWQTIRNSFQLRYGSLD